MSFSSFHFSHRTQRGFTLAETLVYIALFSAISVFVINMYLIVLSSFTTTRTTRDLMESGSSAMERMSREIRQANSIDTSGSTFGTNPGVLKLNSTDASGTAETVTFSVSSGSLILAYNGTTSGALVGANMSITNLVFRRIVTTQGEAVKIEMSIQDTRDTSRTEKFYDTVVLRGAYYE